MYFSVITPEKSMLRQAAYEMAQSSYSEHQWLWQFFSGNPDQNRDFIFRRHDVEQIPRFYIVSQREPVHFSQAWVIQSKNYDPKLLEGQRLSFELRANPVITTKNDKGKPTRHDVVMHAKKQLLGMRGLNKWKDWDQSEEKPSLYTVVEEECRKWLESRAATNGFSVTSMNVDAYTPRRTRRPREDSEIRFTTVDFSGDLTIIDPALFQSALFNGIGHAKAFGCGLVLVKRIKSE